MHICIPSKLSRSIRLYILKESKYVGLANTIYRVLRNSRIPIIFLHPTSNHVFSVWQQHIVVLLTIPQYESKSFRMFVVDWLVEAYYLRMFLQLSHISHYTTLQKFAARIDGTLLLWRIISSFIYYYYYSQTSEKYLLE